jgi:tRNA nucleotidyltransferase (CCA-adding enzyme)
MAPKAPKAATAAAAAPPAAAAAASAAASQKPAEPGESAAFSAPRRLPRPRPELAARIQTVARLAVERGIPVYLVGGTVRDLLLGRGSPDLDFVAVGDGPGLAAAVQRQLGGRLLRHDAFLTADVIDAAGIHLDLATARGERYAAVAALPEVWPAAALDDDLRRRDFTVNAMAVPLLVPDPAGGGDGLDLESLLAGDRLIDPCGGRRDLAAGALRVLHAGSFLDDPTRVLRGVRFEAKLGLRLTAESETLVRQAVAAGAFARLSGSRLRHEIELLLEMEGGAEAALAGLERLQELGVLGTLHSRLVLDAEGRRRLLAAAAEHEWYRDAVAGAAATPSLRGAGTPSGTSSGTPDGRTPAPPARRWLVLLLALAAGLTSEQERGEMADRLLLAGDDRRLVSGFGRRLAAALPRLGPDALPHEADAALAGLMDEELVLLAATAEAPARAWVRRYLTELRPLALGIRGADLLAAGARGGPEIGYALRSTREARLDGRIGAGEELAFALELLARAGSAAPAPQPLAAPSGDHGPGSDSPRIREGAKGG